MTYGCFNEMERWICGTCKNYDGVIQSDTVAQEFTLGLMTSVFGNFQTENEVVRDQATHGTVTRHQNAPTRKSYFY
jgi:isocitrate dehydrogenase